MGIRKKQAAVAVAISLAMLSGQALYMAPTYAADVPSSAGDVPSSAANAPSAAADVPSTAANAPSAAADVPSTAADVQRTAPPANGLPSTYTRYRHPRAIAQATSSSAQGLSAGARDVARMLGILPQVERLLEMKRARGGQRTGSLTDEELDLKVDVFDKVLGASLEVRMVGGRIDRELAWAYAGLGMLTGKKQSLINNMVTFNFTQIGVLGVLSGPAFLHQKPTLGTELLLIASCIGLTVSTATFLVNKWQGSKPVDGGNTVLTDVFHLQAPTPNEHEAHVVAAYMNAVPSNSTDGQTRIQSLIAGWKKGKYLRQNPTEAQLQKLSAIEPPGKKYHENIKILNNRIRMLFDTQYTIESLDADLLEILRATDLG